MTNATPDTFISRLAESLSSYRRGNPNASAVARFPNPELLTPLEQRRYRKEIFLSFVNREISNREQLGWFIQTYLKYKIPDVAVCPGHTSPLDVIWTIYHERPSLALWVSNRGSGKTRAISALNITELITRPDYEICHSAAIQSQALRAYNYFRQYQKEPLIQSQLAAPPTQSKSTLLNGSNLETIVTTWSGVNSPHVPTLRLDEVELIKEWDLLMEALFIPQSSGRYQASTLLASTRKWEVGIVQRLVEESAERGIKTFISCIFEALEPCDRDCEDDPTYGRCYGMNLSETTKQPYCGGKAHSCSGFYQITDFLNNLEHMTDEALDAQTFCRTPYSTKGPKVYPIDEQVHVRDWEYFKEVTGFERPPANWKWLAGNDFGVCFAFVLIVLDPFDRAWVVGEYYHDANPSANIWHNTEKVKGPRLLSEHYKSILKIPCLPLVAGKNEKELRPSPRLQVWPDPSGNQEILELTKLGMPVVRIFFGKNVRTLGKYNNLSMGVDEVKARLKVSSIAKTPRLIFIKSACPNTVRQMIGWTHPVDNDGKPILDAYSEDEDHCPDCVRYPLYGHKSSRRIVTPGRLKNLY